MFRGGDDILTADKDESRDSRARAERAPGPAPRAPAAPARPVAAPRTPLPEERDAVIARVDEALGVIGEILDLMRQRSPRGSQTRIFVEAAAIAATRARGLAQGLIQPEAAPETPADGE